MIFLITIGNAFSEEERKNFANRNFKIGSVIRFITDDIDPPKEKRVVILGKSEDFIYFGHLFFSSEINPNVFRSVELKKLQIPFKSEDCSFLDHDSYLDCSKIRINKFDKRFIGLLK